MVVTNTVNQPARPAVAAPAGPSADGRSGDRGAQAPERVAVADQHHAPADRVPRAADDEQRPDDGERHAEELHPDECRRPEPEHAGQERRRIDDAEDERSRGRGQRDHRSDDRERPSEAADHRAQARSAKGIPAGPVSDIGASSSVHVTRTLRDCRQNEYRYAVTKEPSPRLDIRLLGPPEVLVDGAPLVVDTRKAVAILALLGAEGRAFARDELAALLWPDSETSAANGALRRTLSSLRAAAGPESVLVDRARVALDPARVRVDLADLERLAGSDSRRSLAAAAALARGPFLAGFNLRDSPEFDDWRAARAVAVERTVMTVLDKLAAANLAAGDLPGAIAAASHRLDLDPLDEAGHVRLMDLYARSGDRAAALRQYRLCVAILDRELGVAPLASTSQRYEAIRDADEPAEASDAPAPGPGPASDNEPHGSRCAPAGLDPRRPG